MWHSPDDNAPAIPTIPKPRSSTESAGRPAQPRPQPRRVPRQAPPGDR